MARIPAPERFLGSTWFRWEGAKQRMRDHTATAFEDPPDCELQLNDPDTGHRRFGAYKTWAHAEAALAELGPDERHAFEVGGRAPHTPCAATSLANAFARPAGAESFV